MHASRAAGPNPPTWAPPPPLSYAPEEGRAPEWRRHDGSASDVNDVFFVDPPSAIGTVVTGETTLNAFRTPSRRFLLRGILGLGIAVALFFCMAVVVHQLGMTHRQDTLGMLIALATGAVGFLVALGVSGTLLSQSTACSYVGTAGASFHRKRGRRLEKARVLLYADVDEVRVTDGRRIEFRGRAGQVLDRLDVTPPYAAFAKAILARIEAFPSLGAYRAPAIPIVHVSTPPWSPARHVAYGSLLLAIAGLSTWASIALNGSVVVVAVGGFGGGIAHYVIAWRRWRRQKERPTR